VKVAYQGAPGAFGHEACLAFLPRYRPEARESFAEVARAVAEEEAERGMLPLSNSRAGPVPGVAEAIEAHALNVLEDRLLPVRMHLLALPGTSLGEVRMVVSHPMALRQCAARLRALGLAGEEAANTAVAARDLREADKAVLGSEAAAAAYGLAILLRDVHDDPANATRFAIVGRRDCSP
jgi:prephenate dehydratase